MSYETDMRYLLSEIESLKRRLQFQERLEISVGFPWTPSGAWTYASATTFTLTGDKTDVFTAGTKIRLKQGGAYKYFYVVSSAYSAPNTTVTVNGASVYTLTAGTITDNYYSYACPPDFPLGACSFVPLTSPLTSTSWDGDARSTTGKTKIDLSAVFGVPDGVKAVYVRLASLDSGSFASTTTKVRLSPNSTAGSGSLFSSSAGRANNTYEEAAGIVPCDINGDIYYQITASGTNTTAVILEIWGYWI